MTNIARRAALAASLILAGCCSPDRQRIAADRATYDWFAPLMMAYIATDAGMDEAAKQTHLRGLQAWNARIAADERAAGAK